MKLMKPRGSVSQSMWDDPDWMADQKIDGYSGRIEFDREGSARLYKAGAEITANFLPLDISDLADLTIHVEWAAGPNLVPQREYAATLVAHNGYKYVDNPSCYILDVVIPIPLAFRFGHRHVVCDVLSQANWVVEFKEPDNIFGVGKRVLVDKWVAQGHEGAVFKTLDSVYAEGYSAEWRKYKPGLEIDAWVMGYNPGGGKYEGTVGSLKLYLFDDQGEPKLIGSCSGMTDGQRHMFKDRLDAGQPFAVQVTFQRWATSGGLLHPSFHSLRPDKGPSDCSFASQKV